jgi:predicted nucleic acid-binding protein
MILVIDTNRIIAALIKDSASRKIIYSDKFLLLTPKFTLEELKGNRKEILTKTRLSGTAFESLLSIIMSNLYVVDDSIIKYKLEEAKRIMDKIDKNDTPFIALALAIANDGIWTDDKHFERQNRIKVWKTSDLIRFI